MLKELLEEVRKYQREEVCYKTKISMGTLDSLLSGRNTNPKLNTVMALQNFVREKQNELSSES